MKARALVSLNIENNNLVYAGRGYQENSDIPQGQIIGDVIFCYSDKFVEVEYQGKKYQVLPGDIEKID